MSSYFKIYGCERTCTNYWRKLLLDNFDDYHHIQHPWVHGEVYSKDEWKNHELCNDGDQLREAWRNDDVDFYITTKNPCAWIVSVSRALGNQLNAAMYEKLSDQTDILSDVVYKLNEKNDVDLSNDEDFWFEFVTKHNIRHDTYCNFLRNNENAMLVRHEDLIKNSGLYLRRAKEYNGLKPASDKWSFPDGRVEPDPDGVSKESGESFDLSYYTASDYLNCLNETMHEALNRIRWDLMRFFGYTDQRHNKYKIDADRYSH